MQRIKGHINTNIVLWVASAVTTAIVGFGTWTVSQIHATQVQASSEATSVDDLKRTVENFQTSVDALNTKVDASNHTLDNIAGVLGIKQK